MDRITIKDVFDEISKDELDEFENFRAPYHHFSRRHRKAMNKILYPKKTVKRRKSLKWLILVPMVIFYAAMTITAFAVMPKGFVNKADKGYNELFTSDIDSCPRKIQDIYSLSVIPVGYELNRVLSTDTFVITTYSNPEAKWFLTLYQSTKKDYRTRLNNEYYSLSDFEIDGAPAIFVSPKDTDNFYNTIICDRDDYILELSGEFTKDELTELIKSAEV